MEQTPNSLGLPFQIPHRKDGDQVTRLGPSDSDDTLPTSAQVGDGTSGSTPDIQGPPTEFQSIVKRVEKGEKLSGELGFIGSGLGECSNSSISTALELTNVIFATQGKKSLPAGAWTWLSSTISQPGISSDILTLCLGTLRYARPIARGSRWNRLPAKDHRNQ